MMVQEDKCPEPQSVLPCGNRVLVIDDDPEILDVFRSILGGAVDAAGRKGTELEGLLAEMMGTREHRDGGRRVFWVDTATQGQEGFEKVRKAGEEGYPFAVVFIDMRMPPGWDGIKTAREIRRHDPHIQIVIVTAYSDAGISEIVEKVGFTNRLLYLKKPFDDEEILQLADSLSMRWNLERKVKHFMDILESIIGSFVDLKLPMGDQGIKITIRNVLGQLCDFMGTRDVFLAKVSNGSIEFNVGLGRFANGITHAPSFQAILQRFIDGDQAEGIFRIEEYFIMPIILKKCKNVLVGIRPDREIEGVDAFLTVLAVNVAKIFDMAGRMSKLQQEVIDLRRREEELSARIRQLEKGAHEEKP